VIYEWRRSKEHIKGGHVVVYEEKKEKEKEKREGIEGVALNSQPPWH